MVRKKVGKKKIAKILLVVLFLNFIFGISVDMKQITDVNSNAEVSVRGGAKFQPHEIESKTIDVQNYQKAIELISQAIKDKQEEVDIEELKLSHSLAISAVNLAMQFSPYSFGLDHSSFKVNYYTESDEAVKVFLIYHDISDVTLLDMNKKFNKNVNSILITASEAKTDIEKITYVYDYLESTTIYDSIALEHPEAYQMSYSAYGAIVNKHCVCSGYASAFKLLMDRLNIPCESVQSDEKNHIWNMVKINNHWYHLDLASEKFAQLNDKFNHYYFMMSDTETSRMMYDWKIDGYTNIADDSTYDSKWSLLSVDKFSITLKKGTNAILKCKNADKNLSMIYDPSALAISKTTNGYTITGKIPGEYIISMLDGTKYAVVKVTVK
jgi:hypothetical protein